MLDLWEKKDYANPDTCIKAGLTKSGAEPYSIVLPPPNVTGTLHMGHAAMLTIEDILIRYHRMRGYKTLWIPGTDSAAIATQSKVESEIYKKEKKTRHDIGREELLRRINIFTDESKATIINQVKRMGSSLDWSRYAYTLDDTRYAAVMEAFVRMYEAGLIYRGDRIVNWDPKGQTTISDDEIVYEERDANLVTFKYSQDFPIAISTTRLETKVGDTAVAVHPDDENHKQYVGKEYDVVFCDVPLHIKIVADDSVDPTFGTGALGVTPAHSQTDWDIANRHNLPRPQVINEYAKMVDWLPGRLPGQKVLAARETILAWLKEQELFINEKPIKQNVSTAERTGGIVEPLPKRQWFMDVNKEFTIPHSEIPGIKSGSKTTLKKMMKAAVENDGINILPERFERVYYNWIDNLRDWCISRQIWFGHQLPVWYDIADPKNKEGMLHYRKGLIFDLIGSSGEKFQSWAQDALAKNHPIPVWGEIGDVRIINFAMANWLHQDLGLSWAQIKQGADLKSHNLLDATEIVRADRANHDSSLIQDPDTLDTWFSSGLWTFSTLGWPNKTKDLETYHPTAVLETGYDILFFWVARMILMSGFLTGQVPFRHVYLHGLVRDGKGRKMSKSLGNIIDPLVMIEKYGADATRLSVIIGAQMGNDLRLSEDKVRGYKNFANKLWNIARFVLENSDGTAAELNADDQKLIDEAQSIAADITKHIDTFRLDLAADAAYHYVWDRFAAEIVEDSKAVIKGGGKAAASRRHAFYSILLICLRLLHPFMPFVTEAIWQKIPRKEVDLLMVAAWPIPR